MSDNNPYGGSNVAWTRGYADSFVNKGVIQLDTIGRVLHECADEIESLRAEVERWEEVQCYWRKVVAQAPTKIEVRRIYESVPRNLAALLDLAVEVRDE